MKNHLKTPSKGILMDFLIKSSGFLMGYKPLQGFKEDSRCLGWGKQWLQIYVNLHYMASLTFTVLLEEFWT